jgi:uncharacterized membrane protein YphA (DoxX/SURF4 family)
MVAVVNPGGLMIWSKAESRTILSIRLLMSAVFLFYGSVKLLGGQYYYGDWTISKSTADGTSLVWAFYGYSPFYGRMTGLFEFLPAVLLLFRRTTFLGALALFAVGLNITLLDALDKHGDKLGFTSGGECCVLLRIAIQATFSNDAVLKQS